MQLLADLKGHNGGGEDKEGAQHRKGDAPAPPHSPAGAVGLLLKGGITHHRFYVSPDCFFSYCPSGRDKYDAVKGAGRLDALGDHNLAEGLLREHGLQLLGGEDAGVQEGLEGGGHGGGNLDVAVQVIHLRLPGVRIGPSVAEL